jgi:hypothetical protein
MKNQLSKIVSFTLLFLAFSASAGEVAGYYRSNGTYVRPHYRSNSSSFGSTTKTANPNANPSRVEVRSYKKNNGTVVYGHERTRANKTTKDNLRYR